MSRLRGTIFRGNRLKQGLIFAVKFAAIDFVASLVLEALQVQMHQFRWMLILFGLTSGYYLVTVGLGFASFVALRWTAHLRTKALHTLIAPLVLSFVTACAYLWKQGTQNYLPGQLAVTTIAILSWTWLFFWQSRQPTVS